MATPFPASRCYAPLLTVFQPMRKLTELTELTYFFCTAQVSPLLLELALRKQSPFTIRP